MFIGLFIIAKKWEQLNTLSTKHKWLYTHTKKYYTTMKRNEPQPHITWMYLTNKMLNERSQITECICYTSIKFTERNWKYIFSLAYSGVLPQNLSTDAPVKLDCLSMRWLFEDITSIGLLQPHSFEVSCFISWKFMWILYSSSMHTEQKYLPQKYSRQQYSNEMGHGYPVTVCLAHCFRLQFKRTGGKYRLVTVKQPGSYPRFTPH